MQCLIPLYVLYIMQVGLTGGQWTGYVQDTTAGSTTTPAPPHYYGNVVNSTTGSTPTPTPPHHHGNVQDTTTGSTTTPTPPHYYGNLVNSTTGSTPTPTPPHHHGNVQDTTTGSTTTPTPPHYHGNVQDTTTGSTTTPTPPHYHDDEESTTTPIPTTTSYYSHSQQHQCGLFYPFGTGDTINGKIDDGSSSAIVLLQPFIYFGKTYNQAFVNNNGHLTFDSSWYRYIPYQFPAHGGRDIIAPFWTDMDNRENGVISYRQYTSGDVLIKATEDINQYFPELSFSATWVFVATWDKVAYYPTTGTETSFQVVLISNGLFSFILMNYGMIGPTTHNVQAGYDTANSSSYFSIPGSFQQPYSSFTSSSNVNALCRWAFRVDHETQTCQFNGSSVPLDTTFWTDHSCQQKCTCTRAGLQCISQPCTFSQACRPAAFQYSCQNIPRRICRSYTDPHYITFDGRSFGFQGICTYILSEACGSHVPYYRVEVKNEHRGSTYLSWTRLVRLSVYNKELELVKGHPSEAKVNGTFAATPFSLNNGAIQVFQSGGSVVINTDFGLVVTYDTYRYVTISVPYDYQNSTCGLCGNFNHRQDDDFRTPSGEILSSISDFANSWKAPGDNDAGCQNTQESDDEFPDCTTVQRSIYNNSNHCGMIADPAGPFHNCHSSLPPQTFADSCVYDLCVGNGYQPILCGTIGVYATQCQQLGIQVGQWRTSGFCEMSCTEPHSHYEFQGTSCPATCSNPSAPSHCTLPSQESCICDDGYILSGGTCVPQSSCGCTFEGLYYSEGQSAVLDNDCGRFCTCTNMTMNCQHHQCGSQEVCTINNGVRGCRPLSYSTCWVDQLGSFHTFDGLAFSYPGACELILTQVNELSQLDRYAVIIEKVPLDLQSFSKLLKFEAYGKKISIEMKEGGIVQVNDEVVGLPFSIANNKIIIYHSSVDSITVETSFGVTVRADWSHLIRITAPSTYNGTLTGLCGNFNGNQGDEFYSPGGFLLDTAQMFANSWRIGSLSANCIESDVIQPGQNSSEFTEYCNIMDSPHGPFAQCHSSLDPQIWSANCRHNLEQTHGAKEALCEALQGYTLLCQQYGISVGEWKNLTTCDFSCPVHSHYEECGISCPAACPSLSFPFPCTQYCQAGCQCNDGLVLSGGHCVSPTGCGCFYEGRYRQSGEQFWFGEQCQFNCVCDGTSSVVHCNPTSCQDQEVCRIIEGEYGCHAQPSATCSASGDPHYSSFDGHRFDFQGTCHYTLATVCNDTLRLPYFQVTARNEAWNGQSVSVTVDVYVNVSGHLVHVSHNMYGMAEIDGETRTLPAVLDSGRVSVYSSGQNTFITTEFGLRVSFGSWTARVTVPGNYSGATCGLCGNFNGNSSDDFRLQSGALTSSASEFGADWKVGNDPTCNDGTDEPACTDPSRAQSMCAILMDAQGPLSFCHTDIDPEAYFDDCVFDLCLSDHRHDVLCRSIETYITACQSADVRIYPWRENTTCGMECPVPNSHYELCGSDCGYTCTNSINETCEGTCTEGCFCDEGFVRSGGNCVPVQQCGCSYNGFYFQAGEKFWTEGCSQHCECFAQNDLRCFSSFCTATEECVVKNGRLGCYSPLTTCMVSGDPHYYTFDGAVAHFQGACSYEISQSCGNLADNELQFRVVGTNMHRGSKAVSFVSVVDVWLMSQEQQTHITIGQNKRVKVDGNEVDSSNYQISHLTEIYHEQNFVVVNASHELMVYFDGRFTLLVRLGPSFQGSVCGMCGNNNGDLTDDKTLPNGTLAPNDAVFGNSWKSNISRPGCGATEQHVDVDDCPFREEYSKLCSIITNTSGPFRLCHFRISPESYFNSCLYDLCSYPQTWGQDLLCSAVESYAAACNLLDLQIPDWHSDLSCSTVDPCKDLNCTEDEWCGTKNGIYGCFCNDNNPRSNPDSYDSSETCESSSGTMSLSRCQLFEAGFPDSNLHLNDPTCKGTLEDGRLVFHFDNDDHICGTNLTANGTHFIYENLIQGEVDSAAGFIHREKEVKLAFSCIYKLSETFSMDTVLNPLQCIVHKTLPGGEGMYQVRMTPYQDAGFSHPYNGSVNLEVGEQLYIEVLVQGVDSRQIATVIDSCWATPTNQRSHAVRWDLITRKCPNLDDGTVEIIENGVSTTGRFSFKMFAFHVDEPRVFLHCSIQLCLLENHNCAPHCFPGYRRRIGRSVNAHDIASVSLGPFIRKSSYRGV